MKVTFPAGNLSAILLTAAKNDTRFYLNAVLFEVQNGTLFMVATDGHRLSYIRQAAPGVPDGQILIKRDSLEAMLKLYKVHEQVVIDLQSLEFTAPLASGTLTTEDGKFPDWRYVAPVDQSDHHPDATALLLNPNYLVDIGKAAILLSKVRQLSRSKTMGLRLWAFDQNGSTLATVVGAPEYGHVVMAQRLTKKHEDDGIEYTGLPSTQGGETDPAAGLA